MPSLKRHDGELTIDHRASPGLTAEEARLCGLPGVQMGEGTCTGLATVSCSHCGGVWIVNPYRTRERPYCRACDHYICDGCKTASLQADYVHRTIDDLTNLIASGRWRIIGGPASSPIIVPTSLGD